MYQAYWKLAERPFENHFDNRYYYPCEAHQGALLKLRYAVESRCEGVVLAGEHGLGKSLLARSLVRQLGDSFTPIVQVSYPQLAPRELLAYVATALDGQAAASSAPADEQVRAIERLLADNQRQGRHALLICDDAEEMAETGGMDALRWFTNLGNEQGPAATLLLLGTPQLLNELDRRAGLEERMAIKCLLQRLSQEETLGYIQHRLQVAGATRTIFAPDACEAIHELAQGTPRKINRLCDLALLVGFAEQLAAITAEQIETISRELVEVAGA